MQRAGQPMRHQVARALASAVPLLFAVPVLYGLVGSFVDVVGSGHPYFGDISGASADARAVALGIPLYQDPDAGYTPIAYTPFLNVLGGGLDLIVTWDGWPVILTILADAALVAIAARLAYRPGSREGWARAALAAGAVGIGALALWLVAFVPFNSLFAARPDQLAWCFALGGLALLPTAASGNRRAAVAVVALLTFAWWTKQPAIVAAAAATIWLCLAALRGTVSWRMVGGLAGGLAAVGIASFGLADLLTDGWSTTFAIDIPADRPRPVSVGDSLHDLATSLGPAAAACGALWLAAALGGSRVPSGRAAVDSLLGPGRLGIAGALLVFVALDTPAAVFFRQAVGSTHNQFVGLAWALGLLAAVAWSLAQGEGIRPALAAAAVLLPLFLLSELAAPARWLHDRLDVLVPPKEQRAFVVEQPPGLVDYAGDHLVYHPAYPGVGAGDAADLYPGQFEITGLTRAGRQPGYLVRALLDRRFDLVYRFDGPGDAGPSEGNYLWKLNQVIEAKYGPSDDLAPGLEEAEGVLAPFETFESGPPLTRREGPDPAPWMENCFGPFEVAGASWRIGEGGGFWCRPSGRGELLELVRTPAPFSEIRADDYRSDEAGRILVAAARGGTVEVAVGDRLIRRALPPHGRLEVTVPAGSRGIRIRGPEGVRVDLGDLGQPS